NDFTSRFPLAVDGVTRLPAHSFLLDGEAIVTNHRGLGVFELIRRHRHGVDAVLIAFDLIELEGEDLNAACTVAISISTLAIGRSGLTCSRSASKPRLSPILPSVRCDCRSSSA